jgi:DNA repair protein RecO (recombination protein O)
LASSAETALVWRRSDFSETSRLVTLITRGEGKITTLAKGAHRPSSPFLGRIDHLNLVLPRFARRATAGLRLLRGVVLLHEHRALRSPRRFAASSYLCEVFDVAFLEGRADAVLFDLLLGALRVLERCPERALATAVAGVELRFLAANGLLPDLGGCTECGQASGLHLAAHGAGLLCSRHRAGATQAVPGAALQWLQRLQATPGREWAALAPPGHAARSILEQWMTLALERRPRWRTRALAVV